jgi:RimJ/RimL family protein N-acetyltransferase
MTGLSGKPAFPLALETGRLSLRGLTSEHGGFINQLLNEPRVLRGMGDRGVRSVDDARAWIENGPRASYAANGYGLYLVVHRETSEPMGICGLVSRPWLEDPDLGFSLLPAFWSRGYAFEAATAVMKHATATLRLRRILAITSPDNHDSARLLEKLGFRFREMVRPPDNRPALSLWSIAGNIRMQADPVAPGPEKP